MIACGGWGDDIGFYQASKSDAAIKQFAADVAIMLKNTGADGVGMFVLFHELFFVDRLKTSIGSILEEMVATTSKSRIQTRLTKSMPSQSF